MKTSQNSPVKTPITRKSEAFRATSLAIGKKLLEIKKISGAGEMTEINIALFRHLK